ncbi:Acyl-CoA dehydrogenase FadE34 [Methylobacterium crusticola]|uniref:Acyl-CoA dehydrogenase FadE34 n=1 Tax=Methylobacterium crusticola TaxID=1697972 RepID=A0ABQ4QSS1_9HYPH|nr:acyl-CoA dehydrogenase [Methylobacterium crusticola]GJD48358.1 Acyl-CoA dehydrogenase FadE34 [Methylobacterium crusticola]
MSDLDLLEDSASRFFAGAHRPAAGAEGPDEAGLARLWAETAAMGFPLAGVPEDLGGAGMTRAEASVLVRIAAAHVAPVPLAETMAASWVLADAGAAPPEGIATLQAGLGLPELALSPDGDGYGATGCLAEVPWGREAGTVVALARLGGGAALVRLPGRALAWTAATNIAGEPRAATALAGHPLPRAAVTALPPGYDLRRPGLILAALRATQLAGAMQRVLALAIDHANTRVQFGRPIGRFQAIQSLLSEAAGHVAAGSAAADGAASRLDDPDAEALELAVACAKSRAGEAATRVAAIAHQVFGAVGFTREHELHHATRRLWAWREEAGDEAFWNERLGAIAREAGSAGLWARLTAL